MTTMMKIPKRDWWFVVALYLALIWIVVSSYANPAEPTLPIVNVVLLMVAVALIIGLVWFRKHPPAGQMHGIELIALFLLVTPMILSDLGVQPTSPIGIATGLM